MSKPVTSIAPHTFIKGDLRLDGPALIGGRVQGNVTASDALEIGPEGIIDGNIEGTAVTVNGTVRGNIIARQACRLGASACVAGDVCTAEVAMARGARFIGQLCLGDDIAEAPKTPSAQTERAPATVMPATLEGMQVMEATISRIEHLTAPPRVEPAPPAPITMTIPGTPEVQVLTQNVQTLQRAPRIIKAR